MLIVICPFAILWVGLHMTLACRIKDAENSQLACGMRLSQADRAAAQEAANRIQSKLEGEVQRLQNQLRELEHSSRSLLLLKCHA